MIILLNGPPRSGKDTAAMFIKRHLPGTVEYKMSAPLKRGIQTIYGFNADACKFVDKEPDTKTRLLHGQTYRVVQIRLFQHLAAIHGETILADLAITAFPSIMAKHVVISDCGMTIEATKIAAHAGYGNTALIQLHRNGCDFSNDIREYVDIQCKHEMIMNNNYDLDLYELQIKKALQTWKLIE